MRVLVVREPFGDFAKGDTIRDQAAMDAVTEAGQAHFCTPTDIDDGFFADPAPAPADKPAKT